MPEAPDRKCPDEPMKRRRPKPVLTSLVCLLCIGMTIAWNVAVRTHSVVWRAVGGYGYLPLPMIWEGGYLALFNSVFVHGNPSQIIVTILHLGFNLLWLFPLGMLIEEETNPLFWVLFFAGSAVVSSGAEIFVSGHPPIGASGVVYAMFGFIWTGRRKYEDWHLIANRRNLILIVGWGAGCVLLSWLNILHIANGAHFGGLLFGLCMGWIVLGRGRRLLGAAGVALLVAVTVCAAAWMPWSLKWVGWKAAHELAHSNPDGGVYWLQRSVRLGADPVRTYSLIWALDTRRGDQKGAAVAERELRKRGARPPEVADGQQLPEGL